MHGSTKKKIQSPPLSNLSFCSFERFITNGKYAFLYAIVTLSPNDHSLD